MAATKHNQRKTPTATPPTYPPFLKRDLRFHNIYRPSPPGVTKSWQPTTTRCAAAATARQLPQLYHVNTVPSPNPNPYRNNHFLVDSSITESAIKIRDEASYWCLLKSDLTAKTDHRPPTTTPDLGPSFGVNDVSISTGSRSGLMVSCSVYRSQSSSRGYVYQYQRQQVVSIRHECTTGDPFDPKRKSIEFSSVVWCRRKFYATSLQGAVVVMQVSGTHFKITAVSESRGVPSMSCRFFREYLVEMKGEVLLVFLIHEKSLAVVDGVEIFRLDAVKLEWIRVEKLGGNALFLNERCVWVESEEFGCRDDCVYFILESEKEWKWRVFDMKTGCISSV